MTNGEVILLIISGVGATFLVSSGVLAGIKKANLILIIKYLLNTSMTFMIKNSSYSKKCDRARRGVLAAASMSQLLTRSQTSSCVQVVPYILKDRSIIYVFTI